MDLHRIVAIISMIWLAVSTTASPARKYPGDLEARRRSAVDRSMIRLGRSWPPPMTSEDVRDTLAQSLGYGQDYSQMTDLELNPQLREALFHLENYNQAELQNPSNKRQAFVRFGRPFNSDNAVHLIKYFNDEYEGPSKRAMDFIRLGRDTKFIRFGKSDPERPTEGEDSEVKWTGDKQQRIARARNHFLRLGRDAEELNVGDENDASVDRKKRSPDCHDC